ncbi:hypothetical protein [Actinomadura sp. NPDC000600]|uniref:hypothetical protein n=1 Tax=Actinomadura sp. NPDC000600 TaxID=3154262 RepID=UPI00339B89AB
MTVPLVFTQDDLLTAGDFIKRAKERGFTLSLEDLRQLHSHRLLRPLYRATDTAAEGWRIGVGSAGGMNVRGWTFQAALEGRLRDPADEGFSAAWSYVRPADTADDHWWNGFVYSSWQLLDLKNILSAYRSAQLGHHHPYSPRGLHRLVLALATLSPLYLPGILGQLSMPSGRDGAIFRRVRAEMQPQELLAVAGFDPARLRGAAESLLARSTDDPLRKWLPLVRYANYKSWSQLSGTPLACMWQRVAAELLLRAHEELAEAGELEPLPNLSGEQWWTPLHDRLGADHAEVRTLERALAEFGLSPHPRVILLVEGETELFHVPRLLDGLFGITQPQQVRVQITKGSGFSPQLIARYGITPRVGRRIRDRWLLDASLTALVIAMDPENTFATQEKRDEERRKLQNAIREGVRYQNADISQEELDLLVHIRVWGEHTYEFANFTDDELATAITTVAEEQSSPGRDSPSWDSDLLQALQHARSKHQDIKKALDRMRVREDKVRLAQILWPVLREKCERELSERREETPVLRLVLEVYQLQARMAGLFALAGPADSSA